MCGTTRRIRNSFRGSDRGCSISGRCEGPESGASNAGSRECSGKHTPALGEHGTVSHGAVRASECPSVQALIAAGDPSVECFSTTTVSETPETNQERQLFNKLVHQYPQELEHIYKNTVQSHIRLDVFEIFCGPNSQLTQQASQLGMKADRFGLQQGDLQTAKGFVQPMPQECLVQSKVWPLEWFRMSEW